jgi:Kef-type K+ transport system membrane component KefB
MIRAMVMLGVIIALMASTRSFLPAADATTPAAGTALAFGFLLLAALQTGRIFASLRLPRLTGYLLTGLFCGPEVSGLLTHRMVASLDLVNGVAVGLIALSAGTELDLRRVRPRLRTVALVSVAALPLALFITSAIAFIASSKLAFMVPLDARGRVVASATLGVVFASLSPSVALALLSETASEGPVSDTVLGTVVLADIVIIVLFAMVHATAAGVFGNAGGETIDPVRGIMIEIFGSMAVGVVVSLALALYFRRVGARTALFVLAVCFVCAQVGARLHLDVLIITLTAGLLLQNVLRVESHQVSRELEPASLPIFAVFFGVAGARLHVSELRTLWPFALVFVLARGGALFTGAKIGTRLSNAEPVVRRWAPFGLLPQAGVSVGLAVLIERHFPTWGSGARSLILAVITMNELIGPVLLRLALVRAGEAGKRVGGVAAVEH